MVIQDIFRKYPNRYESIISVLCENLDTLDEPEAKASMIWIIGEYAENPFGLAPAAPLQLPEVAPGGGTASTTVVLTPNQINSNTPPTNPPVLQVAVKCSLDVFIFLVPFDLSAVLLERAQDAEEQEAQKEEFKQVWQRVGEQRQAVCVGQTQMHVTAEQVVARMRQYLCYSVARREVNQVDFLYFSAKTSNQLSVFCELALQQNANGVKLSVRTEAVPLLPLFLSYVSEVLRVQWHPQQQAVLPRSSSWPLRSDHRPTSRWGPST